MATTVSKMATTVSNGNDRLRKGKLRRRVCLRTAESEAKPVGTH